MKGNTSYDLSNRSGDTNRYKFKERSIQILEYDNSDNLFELDDYVNIQTTKCVIHYENFDKNLFNTIKSSKNIDIGEWSDYEKKSKRLDKCNDEKKKEEKKKKN